MSQDDISETLEWYIVDVADNNEIKGPFSERDLDVMWQTASLNSTTLISKEGMNEWLTVTGIPRLKTLLENKSAELMLIEKLRNEATEKTTDSHEPSKQANSHKQANTQKQANFHNKDKKIKETSNKPAQKISPIKKPHSFKLNPNPDDPFKIHQDETGLWHIYDPINEIWRTQDENPNEEYEEEELKSNDENGSEEGDDIMKVSDKSKIIRKGKKDIDVSNMTEDEIKKIRKNQKKARKAAEKKKKLWYQARMNANIYVKGLPPDITHPEMVEFFSKVGILRIDPSTGLEKIKLYKDEEGNLKGDGLVFYMKEESVELALEMLNEREIQPGYNVMIDKAVFEQKGDYVPRTAHEIDKIALMKAKAHENKLYSWNDDEDNDTEGLRIVILKGMFTQEERENQENFFDELTQDIKLEMENLGPVQRIKIYENNKEGVIQIKFLLSSSAEECIKKNNGRFFGGNKIECFYYDGVTNYNIVREDPDEEKKRIDDFGKWLEEVEK